MKVVPFLIPKNSQESFRVQVDEAPYLYDKLHQHPELQLTLICRSEGTLVAGDYVGPFGPGDVFLLGPQQPHVFRNSVLNTGKKEKALSISLFFDAATLGPGFWHLPELRPLQSLFKSSNGGFRFLGSKREWLSRQLQALQTAAGMDKIILFLEILRSLAGRGDRQALSRQALPRPIKTADGTRLNRVLGFTFLQYQRPITLQEVAGLAHLTVPAFCKYFKIRTGKTYFHFLNEWRVQQACRLLQQEDWTVATICYETGFSNLSHFNRIFKRLKACSPREFRKNSGGAS